METTGKALVEFWKWAGDKGLVKQNTATGKRAACSQVLSALDDWETLDVTKLNVDDVFRRFTNKRSQDFTPDSLATYKSRFTQALADFLAYTENPEGWKPSSQERTTVKKVRQLPSATNDNSSVVEVPETSVLGRAGLVEYPFPLREGGFAYLRLPTDLKMADVKRLTAYLNALAGDAVVV